MSSMSTLCVYYCKIPLKLPKKRPILAHIFQGRVTMARFAICDAIRRATLCGYTDTEKQFATRFGT